MCLSNVSAWSRRQSYMTRIFGLFVQETSSQDMAQLHAGQCAGGLPSPLHASETKLAGNAHFQSATTFWPMGQHVRDSGIQGQAKGLHPVEMGQASTQAPDLGLVYERRAEKGFDYLPSVKAQSEPYNLGTRSECNGEPRTAAGTPQRPNVASDAGLIGIRRAADSLCRLRADAVHHSRLAEIITVVCQVVRWA